MRVDSGPENLTPSASLLPLSTRAERGERSGTKTVTLSFAKGLYGFPQIGG